MGEHTCEARLPHINGMGNRTQMPNCNGRIILKILKCQTDEVMPKRGFSVLYEALKKKRPFDKNGNVVRK